MILIIGEKYNLNGNLGSGGTSWKVFRPIFPKVDPSNWVVVSFSLLKKLEYLRKIVLILLYWHFLPKMEMSISKYQLSSIQQNAINNCYYDKEFLASSLNPKHEEESNILEQIT